MCVTQDQVAWFKLYLKVSSYCLIANNIRVNDNFEIATSSHVVKSEANLADSADNVAHEHHKSENYNQTVESSQQLELQTTARESNRVLELLNPRSIEMPVNFYKFENMITLSSLMRRLDKTIDQNLYAALSCSQNETNDTFLSDLVQFFCC